MKPRAPRAPAGTRNPPVLAALSRVTDCSGSWLAVGLGSALGLGSGLGNRIGLGRRRGGPAVCHTVPAHRIRQAC